MRKISGQVLSTKAVPPSRAAKLISRFAAVDNGSSPTVSLYLERAAEAFNHLVQFHNKRLHDAGVGNSPDRKRALKLQTDWLEKNPDREKVQGSGSGGRRDRKKVDGVAETNPSGDDAEAPRSGEEEKDKKKKKKKRKSDSVDSAEKRSSKKKRAKGLDS